MASTVVVRPHPASAFERMPDLYSIPEDGVGQSKSPSTRAGVKPPTYSMYPGLQTPKLSRAQSADSLPAALNRPRKLSGTRPEHAQTSKAPAMSTRTRSLPMVTRLGGHERMMDSSVWGTSSYLATTRTPPVLKKRENPRTLGEMCGALPGEVLEVVLEMLKELHLERGSDGCATCWVRDASSLALCSRKWYKAARMALYQEIELVGPDAAAASHKKRFNKTTHGCRLVLLRRTLRANAEIASVVRSLRVPAPDAKATPSAAKGQALLEQYENQVASVVMACPNLERLSGQIFGYDHSFKRLFHALSTRANLKHMDWLIDAPGGLLPLQQHQHRQQATLTSVKRTAPPPSDPAQLQPHEETAFLEQHRAWTKLTSLSVQCLPEAVLAPQTLLARTLTLLPSLHHLHLHDLTPDAFNDTNLLDLPPLKSLTLSNVRGITSSGLSAFATRASSQPLRKLVLSHVPLTSLPALARILSNLKSLASLSLIQSFPPLMPDSDSFVLWMMPYLASSSVSKLHWDIRGLHPDSANAADDILARSIVAGGFPRLRTLRTPNDPEGIFQQLCRPVDRVDLPGDRYRARSVSELESASAPSSPTGFLVKSSTTSSLSSIPCPRSHTSLIAARLAAQARLDRARESCDFQVMVTDEQGGVVEEFSLAGYMGTVSSKIDYHLLPDPGSVDDRDGGLAGVSGVMSSVGESIVGRGGEGCTGCWNRRESVAADKKEKSRWRKDSV